MQIQEMNSKVNGVFVPMINSCASSFYDITDPRHKTKKIAFIISYNNYPKNARGVITPVVVAGTFGIGVF